MDRSDRLEGCLLGTALGDALGLPAEGLGAKTIARRFGRIDRFRLLGDRGFVSDDTELTALVALALVRHPGDDGAVVAAFRRSLVGFLARLPWAIGWTTLRAAIRAAIGLRVSGVVGAGNGAAMRSAVVGVVHATDVARRRSLARALAEVTHRDPRAVDAALFVAETAALASMARADVERIPLVEMASVVVSHPELKRAIERALELARDDAGPTDAARELGTTGYAVHTAAFVAFAFARPHRSSVDALSDAIAAGGDTDTIAAILGAWLGALRGTESWPAPLVARLDDGPFGPSHLHALANGLARPDERPLPSVRFAWSHALVRNLVLFPIVLAHGLRRLIPW